MRRLPTTSTDHVRVSGDWPVTRHPVVHPTDTKLINTYLTDTDPTIDAETLERRRP